MNLKITTYSINGYSYQSLTMLCKCWALNRNTIAKRIERNGGVNNTKIIEYHDDTIFISQQDIKIHR